MRQFGGVEPLIGAVVGLRTFRVDDSGLLLPLYSSGVWYDGVNTAVCSPPTGHHHRGPHAVPADDCECGFYAYGTREAARHNRHNRHTRYVQAVVSCSGGVVAGTQGVRAAHARIDAVWLAAEAPDWLRRRVALRYPSARMYRDADAMLAEHPLSDLPCYEEPQPRPASSFVLAALGIAAVLALGLLPSSVLHGSTLLWNAWLIATVAIGALTAWLVVGAHGAGHLAAAVVLAGVLGWLLAPMFGLAGWLLRVPLLRGLLVGAGGYVVGFLPRHFPVVKTPRTPTFCGVRA